MSTDENSGDSTGEDAILAGEFALGLLDAAEHRRVAGRVLVDSALRAELRQWQLRLAALDNEFADERPPVAALERIESRLFGASHAVPRPSWFNSLSLWRSLAAGATAVAILSVALNFTQPAAVDPQEFATQLVAALQSQEGSGIEFVALYDEATGNVRLTALSGNVAPDRDLELWYIRDNEPAVSMGVVPVDMRTQIDLGPEARAKFEAGIVLALTLEQKGGSPTGVAQGPIVAVGAATPI